MKLLKYRGITFRFTVIKAILIFTAAALWSCSDNGKLKITVDPEKEFPAIRIINAKGSDIIIHLTGASGIIPKNIIMTLNL
jgi:hypothetical protein